MNLLFSIQLPLCITVLFTVESGDAFSAPHSHGQISKRRFASQNIGVFLQQRGRTDIQLHVASPPEVYTDNASLNHYLEGMANRCGDYHNPVVTVASEAEAAFKQCDERNTESFNMLLKAWSRVCEVMTTHRDELPEASVNDFPSVPIYKSRDAAEHMTKLLMDAEEQYGEHPDESLITPNRQSYNLVIEGWARTEADDATEAAERLFRKLQENERLGTDTDSYHGVLDAWAHSTDPGAVSRMKKIWKNMEETSKTNTKILPSKHTIQFLLSACRNRAMHLKQDEALEAADEAYELLQQLIASSDALMKPDVASYSIVIEAYAQVGTAEGAKKAENVMKMLQTKYAESNRDKRFRPDIVAYNSLLKAWTFTNDRKSTTHAEAIVQEMEKVHFVYPNQRSYSLLITCWARSNTQQTAKQILKVLMRMREESKNGKDHLRPTLNTYNLGVDACAKTKGDLHNQMEALKIAFAILKSIEMEPEIEPNANTYSNLLKATANLLPPGKERNDIAVKVFEMAKKAQKINKWVVKFFRIAADSKTSHEILGELQDGKGYVFYDRIPKSWSKNAEK